MGRTLRRLCAVARALARSLPPPLLRPISDSVSHSLCQWRVGSAGQSESLPVAVSQSLCQWRSVKVLASGVWARLGCERASERASGPPTDLVRVFASGLVSFGQSLAFASAAASLAQCVRVFASTTSRFFRVLAGAAFARSVKSISHSLTPLSESLPVLALGGSRSHSLSESLPALARSVRPSLSLIRVFASARLFGGALSHSPVCPSLCYLTQGVLARWHTHPSTHSSVRVIASAALLTHSGSFVQRSLPPTPPRPLVRSITQPPSHPPAH